MVFKIFSISKIPIFRVLDLSKTNQFVPSLIPASAVDGFGFGLMTDLCLS